MKKTNKQNKGEERKVRQETERVKTKKLIFYKKRTQHKKTEKSAVVILQCKQTPQKKKQEKVGKSQNNTCLERLSK